MDEGTINAEVTMDGAVGVLLVNRYRVLKQLGQGGMGSVWLAEDTKLDGRKVAVKMLPSILVSNKRAYAQVKQEALVSLKLTHPNIVAVRAFEEEGGNPFLVMDYIEGQTLDDYLAEKSKLSEEEAVRLLKPVAAALDYAHSQGVVHRDVKPGNVMIDGAGHPYVLDFGIAREVQETMTRVTGKLSSGTLMYMSPEQLHGAAPKSAQDVYSFAAMVYECLKGEPPFSRGQIEYQIEHDAPEPLPRHIAICRGVMAGLGKTPEARPPTCAAVLEKGAKPRGADDGASARKARIAAVLLGVLVLGALVGGGWWWQEWAKNEDLRVKNEALAAERARRAEEARQEAEKRKAEEEKAAAEVEVSRIAEENRRAELAAFQLSAKTDSVHEQIGREPDEMRAFFAAEIRAFENDRKAGDDAKQLSKNVTATNFFTAALAKATALKTAIGLRTSYLSNRAKAETARKSADSVGAKDALTTRYANAERLMSAADALALGKNFAEAIAKVDVAAREYTALRADVIQVTLNLAKSHRDAERWQDSLAAVEKVLGGDPQNDEAIALKKEAEWRLDQREKKAHSFASVVTNSNGTVSRTFTEINLTTNDNLVTEHRRETRTTLDVDGNMLDSTTSEDAHSFPLGDEEKANSVAAINAKDGSISQTSNADSFLGLKFGAVFYGENFVSDADEPTLLRGAFKPKMPLKGFDDYYVYVTPKTHKIVKIYACAKNAVSSAKRWRRHYLVEALEKRYQTWARPRSASRPIYSFDIGGGVM